MAIELTINGKARQLEKESTLTDFLAANGISNMMIAVEYNGDIIQRDTYAQVELKAGDRLEIVRAIGGGWR
jgi:thiamine biosynthesis protein ThiS